MDQVQETWQTGSFGAGGLVALYSSLFPDHWFLLHMFTSPMIPRRLSYLYARTEGAELKEV